MAKQRQVTSEDIAADVEKFLAAGGTVSTVDHTANRSYKDPVTRTRKEQIDWARRNCKAVTGPS